MNRYQKVIYCDVDRDRIKPPNAPPKCPVLEIRGLMSVNITLIRMTSKNSYNKSAYPPPSNKANASIAPKYPYYPPNIRENKEYYRFITCNFIHTDFIHFFMNAYCIYLIKVFVTPSKDGFIAFLLTLIITLQAEETL